jgi:hypothetical protein
MMNARDRLHPTLKGYRIWAEALRPVLMELLGPPPEDHARRRPRLSAAKS